MVKIVIFFVVQINIFQFLCQNFNKFWIFKTKIWGFEARNLDFLLFR